jgi:nitrogen regulatory protein P-II 1
MMRIEAIVRPGKAEDVRLALEDAGHSGVSVTEIKGIGRQKGFTQHYRGSEYQVNLLPKVLISIVVKDSEWERLADVIEDAACTGEIGDGKIFVSPVHEAIRIRTGDRGDSAVS